MIRDLVVVADDRARGGETLLEESHEEVLVLILDKSCPLLGIVPADGVVGDGKSRIAQGAHHAAVALGPLHVIALKDAAYRLVPF